MSLSMSRTLIIKINIVKGNISTISIDGKGSNVLIVKTFVIFKMTD